MLDRAGLDGAAVAATTLALAIEAAARQVPGAEPAIDGAALVREALAPRMTNLARVGEVALTFCAAIRVFGEGEPREAAKALFGVADAARDAVPITASPALTRANALARGLVAGVEVAALGEAFLAEMRTQHVDRPSAAAARERIAARAEAARDRTLANAGDAAYAILAQAARTASEHLARVALDLRPVVRVETLRSMPAAALAWAIYADPARAGELVDRAGAATPLFMPARFEALAPEVA